MNKSNAKPEDLQKAMNRADEARKRYLTGNNLKADQNILAAVVMMFYNDIDKSQQPKGFYEEVLSKYSSIDASPYALLASDVFSNSFIIDNAKWEAFKAKPTLEVLNNDLAYKLVNAFLKNYNTNYLPKYMSFNTKNNELGRLYLKGIMEMDPAKVKMMYPDANSTMRVSYGKVKNYQAKDAENLDYVTTMKGVMEKYVPGDYEFDLPKNYIQLYKNRDFGQYMDAQKQDVVVAFITSNDITGGNSGSPVMNAKGELIGLAFDGNYEALSHKMIFDKDLNRTINVDIRYVLWCIEKLGGAPQIINELKLVR